VQRDAQALSSIIPSLLDLACHLQQHPAPKSLTSAMWRDVLRRFDSIMQPITPDFNPLPAAACLLDPSLAAVPMSLIRLLSFVQPRSMSSSRVNVHKCLRNW